MSQKLQTLQQKREKLEARLRETRRKERNEASKLSKQQRDDDTRRKILAGAWVLNEVARDGELATRFTRAMDKLWLVRDDDRRLYGFPVLSDEEKAQHPNAASLPKKKEAPPGEVAPAAAPAEQSDSA